MTIMNRFPPDTSKNHYNPISRFYHWSMAALIVAAIVAVELHELFPKGSELRSGLVSGHKQLGILAFFLVWLRLSWRARHAPPAIVPEPHPAQAIMAKVVHAVLYLSMIALPALGIAMTQMAEKPLNLLGVPLPMMFAPDKPLAGVLRQTHEALGNFMILLILAHIFASLWHHFRLGDNTLTRMLPPRR